MFIVHLFLLRGTLIFRLPFWGLWVWLILLSFSLLYPVRRGLLFSLFISASFSYTLLPRGNHQARLAWPDGEMRKRTLPSKGCMEKERARILFHGWRGHMAGGFCMVAGAGAQLLNCHAYCGIFLYDPSTIVGGTGVCLRFVTDS